MRDLHGFLFSNETWKTDKYEDIKLFGSNLFRIIYVHFPYHCIKLSYEVEGRTT